MSDHILVINYSGKAKARVSAKGKEYEKYFDQLGQQVSKKLKLSLNDDCHAVINDQVIYSSQELGDCISQIPDKKVQVTIEVCCFVTFNFNLCTVF